MLVLLSSLPPSFESLVIALLVGKSSIKMEDVTFALLQNKILKWKNRVSSFGDNLTLMVTRDDGEKRWSDRRSRDGRSKSNTRD